MHDQYPSQCRLLTRSREVEFLSSTDNVMKGFIKGCLSAPKACALAKNQTAAQLEKSFYQLLQKLKYEPIGIPAPGSPGGGIVLDYSLVSAVIVRALYTPFIWQNTAKCIAALMTGKNTNPDLKLCLPGFEDTGSAGTNAKRSEKAVKADQEAQYGIKCSDTRVHTTNLTDMLPVFEGRHKKSHFFGDYADMSPAQCAQWTLPAKERYMGDFNVTSKNPVLIIGNTYDPVTPLASAKNVTETFKGSVLLQHDSYGVSCSMTEVNQTWS